MKRFIIFMGPQGSGKSTQAKMLAEILKYKFVSCGQELRHLKEIGDPKSPELEKYWLMGDFVPDKLVEDVLFPIFSEKNVEGFILDGYPRSISQIHTLMDFLEEHDSYISHVFYLKVGESECIKRIKIRARELHREDETEDVIRHRLNLYHLETEPLLAEYSRMGRLCEIDGEKSVELINRDILDHFSPILSSK